MVRGDARRAQLWLAAATLVCLVSCGPAAPVGSPSASLTSGTALPPPTASPPPTPTPCSNQEVLDTWPVQRLAEQTLVVPVYMNAVAAAQPEVAGGAGGILLFGDAPGDLRSRLASLVSSAPAGVPPLVMSDEEGGAVQRLSAITGFLPSAREMGATRTPAQIEELAREAAVRMRAAGVTMDLAPVLDVDGGAGPSVTDPDGTRSFSAEPSIASADGLAFSRGLEAGGVIPAVKHFPGLGGASGNTDNEPATTLPWDRLQSDGLQPFADAVAAGAPAVMVSNASVPGLSSLPGTISPAVVTQVLRGRLGFHGLVITDTLSAGALERRGYSVPAAAVAALGAGADLLLFNTRQALIPSVAAATVAAISLAVQDGSLPRGVLVDAVAHVLAAKRLSLCASP